MKATRMNGDERLGTSRELKAVSSTHPSQLLLSLTPTSLAEEEMTVAAKQKPQWRHRLSLPPVRFPRAPKKT